MRWINKKSFLAAGIAVALIWLLVWLLLDPLIKWALVRAGQTAAGAKVEIARVHTSLRRGEFLIEGVQVANKHEPMKNLLQFDKAEFRFSPGQALRAKAVVDDAELDGLQFGTPRKTSGALALGRSKSSGFERKIEEQLAPAEQESLSKLNEAKQLKAEVDPKKLSSAKALDDAQAQLKELGGKTKDKLGVEQIDAQIKQIQQEVDALQKGGNSPADIAAKAKAAADAQNKIKALLAQVQASRDTVNGDYGKVQQALRKADDLKHKDVNGLMKAAGLPSLDPESITKRLLGQGAARKIETALYWIKWARRRHAASQKAKAAQPPPVRRGVDIEFPRPHSYPAFLLVKGRLSGKVAKLFNGRDMDLAGVVEGVASNPPLYGKPARLALSGKAAGGIAMALHGLLDETREPGEDEVKLSYSGFPLAGMALGDNELAADITRGVGRVDGTVRIVGDQWNGRFVVQADGVSLTPKLSLPGPAAQYAGAALSSIRRFTATIGVEGKEDDLRFTIASDIGKTVSDGLRRAASSALLAQRKQLEDKVDALYGPRARQIQSQADALQKQLLAPLDRQQRQLNEQLQKAVARALPTQNLQRALPKGFPKIFR